MSSTTARPLCSSGLMLFSGENKNETKDAMDYLIVSVSVG